MKDKLEELDNWGGGQVMRGPYLGGVGGTVVGQAPLGANFLHVKFY